MRHRKQRRIGKDSKNRQGEADLIRERKETQEYKRKKGITRRQRQLWSPKRKWRGRRGHGEKTWRRK
jgi:hypothetical protein